MMFNSKLTRVLNVEQSEAEFNETLKTEKLERNDVKAMLIAAFLVLTPAILGTLALFYGLIWLIWLR